MEGFYSPPGKGYPSLFRKGLSEQISLALDAKGKAKEA
jgi:hypothetical protein